MEAPSSKQAQPPPHPLAPSHPNVQSLEDDSPGSRNKKIIMRLDLRKLGATPKDVPLSRKHSQRASSKRKSVDAPTDISKVHMTQTTLSADSWSAGKIGQEPLPSLPTTEAASVVPPHLYQTQEATGRGTLNGVEATPVSEPEIIAASSEQTSEEDTAVVSNGHAYGDGLNTIDSSDMSAAEKRRQSPSGSSPEPVSRKRTRNSQLETPQKKKVTQEGIKVRQGPVVKRRRSFKQMEAQPIASAEVVTVAGDGLAIENNNDYCEACLGLGEFICCDSCPKAFHFSCCQPPLDPHDLPDEWNCNECRAVKNPPVPSSAGIFKELLDNVNKTNPKTFSLPSYIQSFFKGVAANSEGEYEDALDQKPRKKRNSNHNSGSHVASTVRGETDDVLELEDGRGRPRHCYHCNKSALGGRMMISCDYCPLHWHLDCLSPPMASAPPNTRKWMCPNHADHVLPRRRKRKDATPVVLDDPLGLNDGNIEVMPEPENATKGRSFWDEDTSGVIYKVPERSIKLGFIDRCRRERQSIAEARSIQTDAVHSAVSPLQFNLLVAAAMAQEQAPDVTNESENQAAAQESSVQNAVLNHITDPAERLEYMRFRAFQQYVRASGAEEAMKQWLDQQEREKERVATETLLSL
ncbi:hypothetical protein BGZ70_000447 [Mortierella alpina]|uniref:PHD-type domain-containing protein n=1 Tax=Mortierella alpina TaxID=64518 RepID=A0A9P6IXS8_MORAP|nr:hypothetical protein BGZ70_000447 [Mortierella alpina]